MRVGDTLILASYQEFYPLVSVRSVGSPTTVRVRVLNGPSAGMVLETRPENLHVFDAEVYANYERDFAAMKEAQAKKAVAQEGLRGLPKVEEDLAWLGRRSGHF